jgi:hypothetical protein
LVSQPSWLTLRSNPVPILPHLSMEFASTPMFNRSLFLLF